MQSVTTSSHTYYGVLYNVIEADLQKRRIFYNANHDKEFASEGILPTVALVRGLEVSCPITLNGSWTRKVWRSLPSTFASLCPSTAVQVLRECKQIWWIEDWTDAALATGASPLIVPVHSVAPNNECWHAQRLFPFNAYYAAQKRLKFWHFWKELLRSGAITAV